MPDKKPSKTPAVNVGPIRNREVIPPSQRIAEHAERQSLAAARDTSRRTSNSDTGTDITGPKNRR
jgi:hypothetical protein